VHPENRGYGANQKPCYRLVLVAEAEIMRWEDWRVRSSGNRKTRIPAPNV